MGNQSHYRKEEDSKSVEYGWGKKGIRSLLISRAYLLYDQIKLR